MYKRILLFATVLLGIALLIQPHAKAPKETKPVGNFSFDSSNKSYGINGVFSEFFEVTSPTSGMVVLGGSGSEACAKKIEYANLEDGHLTIKLDDPPLNQICRADFRLYVYEGFLKYNSKLEFPEDLTVSVESYDLSYKLDVVWSPNTYKAP